MAKAKSGTYAAHGETLTAVKAAMQDGEKRTRKQICDVIAKAGRAPNRRTVHTMLRQLEASGEIKIVGDRVGNTKITYVKGNVVVAKPASIYPEASTQNAILTLMGDKKKRTANEIAAGLERSIKTIHTHLRNMIRMPNQTLHVVERTGNTLVYALGPGKNVATGPDSPFRGHTGPRTTISVTKPDAVLIDAVRAMVASAIEARSAFRAPRNLPVVKGKPKCPGFMANCKVSSRHSMGRW
jgi:DNA-binding CsgD family transcriptional regulator